MTPRRRVNEGDDGAMGRSRESEVLGFQIGRNAGCTQSPASAVAPDEITRPRPNGGNPLLRARCRPTVRSRRHRPWHRQHA